MIPQFHIDLSEKIRHLSENLLFFSVFKSDGGPKINNDEIVISKKVANILIGNNDFRLILKIHYNDKVGAHLIKKNGWGEQPNQSQIDDFFKEECNMIAGRLKKCFEENEINVGISIPLKTSGIDELFFDRKELDKNSFELSWDMSDGEQKLTMAIFVEVIDYAAIEKINFELFSFTSNEDEDVEFF